MPKEAGRHAFATGAVNEGKSTAWLTSAGYWKSPKVPLAKYVHLEKQNVAAEAKATGEGWFGKSIGAMPEPVQVTAKVGKVSDAKPQKNVGMAVGMKKRVEAKS